MLSIYQLKPAFQAMLRPIARRLAENGITANGVTLFALLLSCMLGAVLWLWGAQHTALFLLLPFWMFVRMALNAIDGILAREFGHKSPLGAYLNELSDVLSDAALYLPFVFIFPFGWASIGLLIFLATLSEMTGALGPMVGAPRQYQGPLGKSDRAFLFGSLGLWLGLAGTLPNAVFWLIPLACLAIIFNIYNRIRGALAAVSA